MIAQVDTDGDGSINFTEFMIFTANLELARKERFKSGEASTRHRGTGLWWYQNDLRDSDFNTTYRHYRRYTRWRQGVWEPADSCSRVRIIATAICLQLKTAVRCALPPAFIKANSVLCM